MKSLGWLGPLAVNILVFPGLGHFLLKRFRRGVFWALSFALPLGACLYLVGSELTTLYAQLLSSVGEPDIKIGVLLRALACALVGILVYLGSALDCFWLTRQKAQQSPPVEP
jgi:hypothetical protein